MAKNQLWHDDYWLLLMQLYLRKPVGVKPIYSRQMVELSIELHIAPQQLFARMCEIANSICQDVRNCQFGDASHRAYLGGLQSQSQATDPCRTIAT